MEPNWSYNRRLGFVIENVLDNFKSGLYECKARLGIFYEQTLFMDVRVPRKSRFLHRPTAVVGMSLLFSCFAWCAGETSAALKPFIDDSQARHVDQNNSFVLNCSVSYTQPVNFELKWIVPNPEGIDVKRSQFKSYNHITKTEFDRSGL